MNNELVTNFLKDFGLDDNEIMIYYFIVRTSPQKATTIAKRLRMHKMQVYRLLEGMEKKGVVQLAFESPKRFAATPVENLLNERMDHMKKDLENLTKRKNDIISEWRSQRSIVSEDKMETFAVLQGEPKLRAAVEGLRRRAKKQMCTLITLRTLVNANLRGDHDRIMEGKVSFGYRVLTQPDEHRVSKSDFVLRRLLKCKNVEVRFMNTQLVPFPGFGFIEDEVVLITRPQLESEVSGLSSLWTNNQVIVSLIRKYFEELWQDATDIRTLKGYPFNPDSSNKD